MALPTQAADCPAVRGIAYAECDDEGEAYAAASAAAADQAQVSNAAGGIVWVPMVEAEGNAYVGFIRRSTASTGRTASSKRAWKTKCSARPEEFGWAGGETSASVNVCERGCMYTSSLDPQGAAGYSYSPTGATCTTSDAPAPTPAGDGTDPGGGGGETGGGDGGGTNPGGGDGDGGGGTNPGGGDGGGGTGPGDGDGGGDDGGGDGGGGTGPGPGPGEGDGDGDGPGAPGEDGGPLYEHDKNLTIPKVYAEFEQRVKKAPIIDATKRFFTVSVGGSCPVFTVPASAYWEAMTFDLHCSGAIFALLQLIGWVLLAMAAYKAGEIALT
ncbi:hypothetical protein I5U08_01380 [Stenotrophomonas maltophilia]|nr:hypothetical protein [Stenotrophomonas maltophilia]